ncbi:hypothetical protein PHLCEN_2v3350 [Hermanssonia centrifuga]|uniref:Uncharacterized protein n=1 Tax=Hermanssonia centrifuga TaxID=98765 RepID=A0A2R6QM48_9APHY|nr:hypothetical protein PHLCEN_2v3350 [Hermanssonia centrifuga]
MTDNGKHIKRPEEVDRDQQPDMVDVERQGEGVAEQSKLPKLPSEVGKGSSGVTAVVPSETDIIEISMPKPRVSAPEPRISAPEVLETTSAQIQSATNNTEVQLNHVDREDTSLDATRETICNGKQWAAYVEKGEDGDKDDNVEKDDDVDNNVEEDADVEEDKSDEDNDVEEDKSDEDNMPQASVRKLKSRAEREARQGMKAGNQGKFHGAQLELLESFMPAYSNIGQRGKNTSLSSFWHTVTKLQSIKGWFRYRSKLIDCSVSNLWKATLASLCTPAGRAPKAVSAWMLYSQKNKEKIGQLYAECKVTDKSKSIGLWNVIAHECFNKEPKEVCNMFQRSQRRSMH